jgi:hypothetical protein
MTVANDDFALYRITDLQRYNPMFRGNILDA